MATDTADLAPAPGFTAPYVDLIGKPFEWRGRGPDVFDCYGLIEELERRHGRQVPDYTSPSVQLTIASLIEQSVPFWQPCEEGPGAVATIRVPGYDFQGRLKNMVSHVAMVLPHNEMIHSWQVSGGVCIEDMTSWRHRITGFYRFPQ